MSNHGSGFQIPGVLAFWVDRGARLGGVVLAVGLGPADDVVAPADVVLVEQVGEVGPGVDRLPGLASRCSSDRPGRRRRRARLWALGRPGLQGVDAAGRVVLLRAVGRPLRDEEEVGRQAPRGVRLEHVVLQDEVLGVGPVVRDVARGVVAHHVGLYRVGACRIGGIEAALAPRLGLADEAVHLAAGDVGDGVDRRVRSSAVHVGMVDVRRYAGATGRVGHARRRCAVLHRDAVGAGERPEVGVEGPVLLLDDDHVLDLVDAGRDEVGTLRASGHPLGLAVAGAGDPLVQDAAARATTAMTPAAGMRTWRRPGVAGSRADDRMVRSLQAAPRTVNQVSIRVL